MHCTACVYNQSHSDSISSPGRARFDKPSFQMPYESDTPPCGVDASDQQCIISRVTTLFSDPASYREHFPRADNDLRTLGALQSSARTFWGCHPPAMIAILFRARVWKNSC
eukprot:jgi/Ulvmu1/12482/UM009_0135.1